MTPHTRAVLALGLFLPRLALGGTITTGPTPEEQAQAARVKPAAKAQPKKPVKKPVKKPPANEGTAGPQARPASTARENFRKANPCPSTGRASGSCPGFEMEHMNPLACGGADSPGNMQWVSSSSTRKKGPEPCKTR
jgi:hypothetical protein